MDDVRTVWVAVFLDHGTEHHHAFALERLMDEHTQARGKTYLVRTYRQTYHGDLASAWAAREIDARAGSGIAS